jgi:hypothetical protein
MSVVEKLLGVVMVQHKLSANALFQQILWYVMVCVVLSIILGVLASAVLIGGTYVAYHTLLLNGLEPLVAQVFISFIALLAMGLIYVLFRIRIQLLKNAVYRLLKLQSPIASRLNHITNSFIDGLLEPTVPHQG